jgi:Fe-S cluster biogenesis protein NfuA/nitrite reductase/ring-hydroxylating ferredoxin subunit
LDDRETGERIARLEALLEELEGLEEPARSLATETVQSLVDLYGEAFARLIEGGHIGPEVADDELISHLLLVHDLHPVDLEARVRTALEEVRPYLGSHGGGVELLGVEDGVARLRLEGSCDGCPSSTATVRLAIEDAIRKAAPDIEAVEAEGVAEPKPQLLQVGSLRRPEPESRAAAWSTVGSLPQLAGGGTLAKEVAGEPLLFARLDGAYYAYRDRCTACSHVLVEARLEGDVLICAGCGNRYDVRRAGRCLDSPGAHLEPVPLLTTDSGLVKVALPAAVA